MQPRVYFGLGLLIFFLVCGIYAAIATDRLCTPISEQLEQACDYAYAGQLNIAKNLIKNANYQWDRSWNRLAIVADHSPMDEIDGLFAQAKMYARMENITDFCATCARISQLVTAIAQALFYHDKPRVIAKSVLRLVSQ